VTGGGGFIGRAVCERLVREGCEVAGLDVDPAAQERLRAAGAEFRRCDVTDADATREALADRGLVVHTAAIVGDWGPMDDYIRVNVGGTRNVLDAANAAGADRVVHLSSVTVWGYDLRRDVDDDAEPRPCGWPYSDTKAASDVLARRRGAVVIRPGDVYGPGSIPWTLRPVQSLARGRVAFARGQDGMVTPVYIDDLVDAIVRAASAGDEAAGRGFCVWDGQRVTARDFFLRYARMLGKDGIPSLPRPVVNAAVAAQEAVARRTGKPPDVTQHAMAYLNRRAAYSNARAREELGWEPKVDLDEGMRRAEQWLRAEGVLPVA
jgi:nucleoside-diphosphate-sugar epimerase